MKDYTKRQKILIVLGVSLFILIGSGLTYAGLMWATSNPINIGLTSGCFEINYTPGGAINNANVEVMNESTLINNNKFTITDGIALTYANIGIKSTCTIEGYGSLYLNVTNLSSAFSTGSSKGSLKYAILNNTSSVSTPSVSSLKGQSFDIVKTGTITNTGTINILNKQLSNSTQNKYLIVFYIDGSLIGNDVVGASFAGNISADAHQGKVKVNAVELITDLYTNAQKSPETVNSVTYNLASSVGLMNDRKGSMSTNIDAGNIRYYGTSPNNYIYFNCSDYNNQTSSTCETWRIIGVFDGKVKIMRNENIGIMAYDNDTEDTYLQSIANDNSGNKSIVELLKHNISDEEIIMKLAPDLKFGQSDYSKSSLQKILNNYYYNGLKYTGASTYDFTGTGLKNATTRNIIDNITYNLGGHNDSSIYSNQIYGYERGTIVPSGNATTWTGKIAIPYPSDYGYAADLSLCQKQLKSYGDATCTANNWMKNLITNNGANDGWLLTPNDYDINVWFIYSSGGVDSRYATVSNVNYVYNVIPVLSINSELDIKLGSGTSSSPYQLSVN